MPPQLPSGGQIFLDHVGWFVPGMDAAAAAFGRLGLPMTPLTVHADERPGGGRAPSGTANRCAMIARGYLEVLTRVPGVDSPLARQMDAALARHAGLHLIAFSVADVEAASARLGAAGFDPLPPVALRRPMARDGGGAGTAAFSVLRLAGAAMPEGRIQILRHETPGLVWQPSVTASDNALDMLSGVLVCVADPEEAAARYALFAGRAAAPGGGRWRIALDRGEVAVCGPDACGAILPGVAPPGLPFMAAVAIRSRDVAATRAFLRSRGIRPLSDEPGRVVLSPDDGAGAAFVLHAADADPFPAG